MYCSIQLLNLKMDPSSPVSGDSHELIQSAGKEGLGGVMQALLTQAWQNTYQIFRDHDTHTVHTPSLRYSLA